MAKILINDLPPLESLPPEELQRILGAGKKSRTLRLEALEDRYVPATVTPLNIQNDLAFARVNEPVTSGVPIPESRNITNFNNLRILDGSGQNVPAQFRVMSRWDAGPNDTARPIRWLEVTFAANVPANASATYFLDDAGTGNAATQVQAIQLAELIEVSTGPARFQIARSGFNLFSNVWLDANADGNFADNEQMLRAGSDAFVQQGGNTFLSSNGQVRSVVIEEAGPLKVVVRAEGFHQNDGATLLRYVTRMTFHAGQSFVDVNHTIIEGRQTGTGNTDLDTQVFSDITRAGLRVNLQLAGAVTTNLRGSGDTLRSATLNAGGVAEVSQARVTDFNTPQSYTARINGTQVEAGTQATRAWLGIQDSRWGLSVSTRDFVEKNPQRLRADASGSVEVQFPSEEYRINQAMGLAENTVFFFHTAGTTTGRKDQILEGFSKDRLIITTPGQWMRDSLVFGQLPGQTLPARYARADSYLRDSATATLNFNASGASSGLKHFGDMPIDRFTAQANPENTGWGNSYWDPGASLAPQFARNGDIRLLKDILFPLARHFYTTDMYDPNDTTSYTSGVGGARGEQHRGAWTGEYHYLESLWDYYYLTGDPRALERGLQAARTYAFHPQFAVDALQGENLQTTTRALGQKFNTMLNAWLATGDAAIKTALDTQMRDYLTRRVTPEGFVVNNTNPGNPYNGDQAFMIVLGMHDTIYQYYQATGDSVARDALILIPQRISQHYRVSQTPGTADYMRFHTNVRVTRGDNGAFTVQRITPNNNSDDFFYQESYVGLATALARASQVSGNAALRAQAEELMDFVLPQMNGQLWDKPNSMLSRRLLPGLGILAGTAPDANRAPVFDAIADRTITAGAALNVTARAVDPDNNAVTYSLTGTVPAGATINATTGAITWTPTAAQAGIVHTLSVRATDNGTPSLNATTAFRVTVNAAGTQNRAPVFDVITDRTITAGVALNVTARAVDPDNNAVTYSLTGAVPAGASINATTGVISWTPSAAQAGIVHTLTVQATDNGTPAMSATTTFRVTVNAAVQGPTQITLSAVADSLIDGRFGANPAANYGTDDVMYTYLEGWSGGEVRPMMRFDLSSVPAGQTLGRAVLRVFRVGQEGMNAPTPITVRAISRAWNEASVSWGNAQTGTAWTTPGGDAFADGVAFTIPAYTTPGMIEIDITNIVRDWLSGTRANNGLLFDLGTQSDVTFYFATRESANTAQRPSLLLELQSAAPQNRAPVFDVITDRTITAGAALNVTARAVDPDNNAVTYSLIGAVPAGATINATTGAISWTPSVAQAGIMHTLTVQATDNGTPAMSATTAFRVTVNAAPQNRAPVFDVITDRTITAGTALNVAARAVDPDNNAVTYSLTGTVPAGATINAATGVITWTPTAAQAGIVHTLTVQATDNGTPAMSATTSFNVTVNAVATTPMTLNMNTQPGGNNTIADVIRVRRVGDNIIISRNNVDVLTRAAATISTIEITGSRDADSITVSPDVNMPIRVNGGAGTNTLRIEGAALSDEVIVSPNRVVINGSVIDYTGVQRLQIYTFGGEDEITAQGTTGVATFVDAGTGADRVNLTATNLAMTVEGGLDGDTITGPNQANTWTLSGINSGAVGAVAFRGIERLEGGEGNDAFNVRTGARLVGVDAGMTGIVGNGGVDTLSYSGYGAAAVVRATQMDDSVSGTATGVTNFSGIETVAGSAYLDTLIGPDQFNIWQVSGANTGTLNVTLRFVGVESLRGGSEEDIFRIANAVGVSGSIDGMGGSDTLDYSTWVATRAVAVNLAMGTATAVARGSRNIENAIGGAGNDTLIGNAANNILLGGAGNDRLDGGLGRDLLIGGQGRDRLSGQGDEDILIGSETIYDDNMEALRAVMSEWGRLEQFDERMASLQGGVGEELTRLVEAETVLDDDLIDELFGGDGMNWMMQ